MSLSVGSRLGPYEILAPLGAGGMGEVYRARDAKLNRDVAIKVLPELFSVDADRLARFRREAQVLALLNHQNIGHIYGLEDSSGIHALVLELVEGPTLADRIREGPIPLDDAIPIARQIADALECAHEQGIIHRDLKPANIKLRPDGTVKVLDFGLAKAFESTTGSGTEVMNSPTLTARGTQIGVIVGTAAYMAPEQARGKAVDRRADIWAFGVVLYEMLAGKRAFEGDDISITLASVLKDDLDWNALTADLPTSVMRVLRRCLEKDPKRRLSAIGDARLDLEETSLIAERATSVQSPVQPIPLWRRALPWTVAAAALVLAVGTLVLAGWRAAPAPDLVRVTSAIGAPGSLYLSGGPAFALSPDGKTLALVVNASGRRQIYVRRLANLEATPLAGTEEASAPFFSPDGQWIAFFAGGKLKKIAVTGGAAMPLCDAQNGRGGTWTADGTIIFQRNAAASAPLHRVGEGGGTSEPFGALAEGETTQRWPQALPGGHVLYTGNVTGGGWDTATLMVRPHDGSAAKVVVPGGYYGRYVPATSHLVYINRAVLYAVPFDLARLQTSGNAVPVIDGVLAAANGSAHITISDTGRVVYLPGHAVGIEAPVHLVDKAGKLTVLRSQVADWYSPRFSPDGTKLALTIGAFPGADVWIHEADRDLTKLTFNSQADAYPVWTPDGSRIAFSSAINGPILNLFWRRANGTGEPQRLTTSPNAQLAGSFHKSGKFLAFTERTVERDNDVMILELEGDEKSGWTPKPPTAFVATPFSEGSPSFSPDGRWMAYVSGESGRPEIYVQPFPAGDGRWKVSTDSGIHPMWSPARSELLYLQLGAQFTVMAVPYTVEGASFRGQAAVRWTSQLVQPHAGDRPYDVHPKRDLIAFVKPPDDQSSTAVNDAVFIFDFFEELRRVAAKK